MRFFRLQLVALVLVALFVGLGCAPLAHADNVYAAIRGSVTDPSGAVLPGATVTALNADTGVARTVTTNSKGAFELSSLPIGLYNVTITKDGFKAFKSTGILLVVNQVYALDAVLSVGASSETVEVKADTVQVETSDTQLKDLIDSTKIVDLPLVNRNWTSLEQLTPGIQSSSDRFGTYSSNGSQSNQSSYLVDGTDTNDLPLNAPAIVPSPDSIAQFNMVTSSMNAEYGRNSGAVVNAITKSGTNQFHGDAFEFYRDTFLNNRSYFATKAPNFHQNVLGGTLGGPIWRDKSFFFFSYEGLRNRTGAAQDVHVFSNGERDSASSGYSDFSDRLPHGLSFYDPTTATYSSNVMPFAPPGGACPSGVTYVAGTTTWGTNTDPNTGLNVPGCFADATHIPTSYFNSISTKILANNLIPAANTTLNGLPYYAFNTTNTGSHDQYIFKIDHNISKSDIFWFKGLMQTSPSTATLPFVGGTLPGFAEVDARHYKQFVADYTRIFTPNLLNEFRAGYTRTNLNVVNPQTPIDPSTYGFAITPQNTAAESLPYMSISGYGGLAIGFSHNGPQPRVDETYEAVDNLSWNHGKHSAKMGVDFRRMAVNNPYYSNLSGAFNFSSASPFSTGDGGLDFLLGVPNTYGQFSGGHIIVRAYEYYFYAQDSYKATPALTLNGGIGYQIDTPLNNFQFGGIGVNCFSLVHMNQQSIVYPTAPPGTLFPGDPNCTAAGGYSVHYGHFGPRAGFAWSPDLGKISAGDSKKFSIRGGAGLYFNRAEEEGALHNLSASPFTASSNGAADFGGSPAFANPFADVAGRGSEANRFPFTPPSRTSNYNFANIAPFDFNTFDSNYVTPYAINFNLNVQRELASNMVLTVGYVGSLGRKLIRVYEGNPITQAGHDACLAGAGLEGGCVANRTLQHIYYPQNAADPLIIPGSVDPVHSPNGIGYYISDGVQATTGSSNYNALQVSLNKAETHNLSFTVSYTYSHALDNGSGLESSGFNGRTTNWVAGYSQLNYGGSDYDARHRFVTSYNYIIPVPAGWSKPVKTVAGGWHMTGITTFATGFPVTLFDSVSFNSLYCDAYSYYGCPDVPQQLGTVKISNPRSIDPKTTPYFDPSTFTTEALGTFGNTHRNFFAGPGSFNTDFSFIKDTHFTERQYLQLGIEGFNVFNRANFSLPDGNIGDGPGSFATITGSAGGRLWQIRAKYYF
jgi:hypothetical protein